jgi:hypothetical protein
VRRWADAALAAPYPLELGELGVERTAAAVEVDARDLVVVLAPAGSEPEHQPPARQVVDRRRLLSEQRRVRAQRRDQDVGREPDPLGHRRRGGERDQRLVVGVDDPVDRPERGEPRRLGAHRPFEDARAIHAPHRVRQPDPDVHRTIMTG